MSLPPFPTLLRRILSADSLLPRWVIPFCLFLLTLAVYGNSFPGTFILDDNLIISINPLVQHFDLIKIFRSDYWYGIENSGLYRPITVLTLALNRLLSPGPFGFHLTNVLLQGLTALLLWLVLPAWNVSRRGALFAALLFAALPLHTEVVNIAVGRSELLVAVFLFTALYFASRNERFSGCVVVGTFALALFSKEHAIVLLAILPLVDAYREKTYAVWRRRWRLYAALLGVVIFWLFLRQFVVIHQGPRSFYSTVAVPLAYVPWDDRILTALLYQGLYLVKLLIPWDLQSAYSMATLPGIVTSLWSLSGLLIVFTTSGVIGVIAYGVRRWQLWALLAACYFITFAPTANIVIPVGVTFAERLAYLPSLWFCAGMALLVDRGLQFQKMKLLIYFVAVAYLGGLATATVIRNQRYQSEIQLWSAELRDNPANYIALYNFADALNVNNRTDEAERAFLQVLEMRPDFSGAIRSYTTFLVTQKRFRDAIDPAQRVLALSKKQGDYVGVAYDLDTLGGIYFDLKEYDKALEVLNRPEAVLQENTSYHFILLGRTHSAVGDYSQAVEAFKQVTSYDLEPHFPLQYGLSLLMIGRLDEARIKFQEAIRTSENAEAWNMLGTVDARQEHFGEAAKAFARAVELEPENRYYRENLQRAQMMMNGGR